MAKAPASGHHQAPAPPLQLIRQLAVLLKRYDNLPGERRRTARTAHQAFPPLGTRVCAICGTHENGKIVAAHIVPLEEAGLTTEANLLPLCDGTLTVTRALAKALEIERSLDGISIADAISATGQATDTDLHPASIGCHRLFDAGFMPRSAIRAVHADKERWGHHIDLRFTALNLPIKAIDTEFSPATSRARRVRRAREAVKGQQVGSEDWAHAICEVIAGARKLLRAEFAEMARSYSQDLGRAVHAVPNSFSAAIRSRYFYETALLELVDRVDFKRAIQLLRRSIEEARSEGKKSERSVAMSQLELAHVEMFSRPRLDTRNYQLLRDAQESAMRILSTTRDGKRADGWIMNGLLHRAELEIKVGHVATAESLLDQARAHRETLTVATGWTQYQVVHMNAIQAAIMAHRGMHRDAVSIVARSLAPMQVVRGKRPERHRDLGACAAWLLEKLGEGAAAREADLIVAKMTDGRSGFWAPPVVRGGKAVEA